MSEIKSWEKGPWPLISLIENGAKDSKESIQPLVSEMIVIHNGMIRCINAIYLQCVNIEKSPQDIPDFVEYSIVWSKLIREHHGEEESGVFPDIERETGVVGLMAGNIEQHHIFHDGIEQYEAYLEDVKAGKTKYDGQKLREVIDSFAPALHQHLVEEIPTLAALKKYSDKVDWSAWWQKTSAEILKKASANQESRTILLPFLLSCHDPTFEGSIISWPAMPWIAKLLVRWYYIPQHKSWWRFGPVTASGKPQEVPFA